MARWAFVTFITALLVACGPARESGDISSEQWSAEQLQNFQVFKSDPSRRAAVAEAVARSFPVAFNHEELRATRSEVRTVPQERLVELLGRPSASFSLVERPEYFGAKRRQLDFDPRELHILLYDVDCLPASTPASGTQDVCSRVEAIALKQRIVRVRLVQARREEAVALLSQPSAPAARTEQSRLIAEMPQPGWNDVTPGRALALAKQFGPRSLDAEFYEHGDAVYGRIVAPMQLIKTSATESVCIAGAEDIFVPSLQQDPSSPGLRREANLRIAVFAATLETCNERYREGRFVRVMGESLAATQLAGIHDLFVRRFASDCDVPAWQAPEGLLHATGGAYRILVAPPVSGRDRWSFDVTVEFSVAKGGEYSALVAISPWGTRLRECRQSGGARPERARVSGDL